MTTPANDTPYVEATFKVGEIKLAMVNGDQSGRCVIEIQRLSAAVGGQTLEAGPMPTAYNPEIQAGGLGVQA